MHRCCNLGYGAALTADAEMSGPQQTSMSHFLAGCSSKRNGDEQVENAIKKKKKQTELHLQV